MYQETVKFVNRPGIVVQNLTRSGTAAWSQGLGVGVGGLEFRARGSGLMVQSIGFRMYGLGFGV